MIPPKIEETSERSPMEMIGEKSMLPILNHPFFEKRFKYGSQIRLISLPNFVNFMPGNQLKMMSTKHKVGDKEIVYTKGAMDQVLKNTTRILINGEIRKITDEDKEKIVNASDSMAHSALRVLALAYKECESLTEEDLIFVGLVGMIDPPRPEAKDAVSIFNHNNYDYWRS